MLKHLRQKDNPQAWATAVLLLLLVVTLFPYGLLPFHWLYGRSPALAAATMTVVDANLTHIIGHAALFMLLGTAVLYRFPALLQKPGRYLAFMLLVGSLQEFFQIIGFKHRSVVADDLFDVAVDMTAALIIFFIIRTVWKREVRL